MGIRLLSQGSADGCSLLIHMYWNRLAVVGPVLSHDMRRVDLEGGVTWRQC